MRRAAVLGSPVAHSLSPALHRAAYAWLGLDGWSYDAVRVDEPDLPAFLDGLDGSWAGLSLTMPLKRAVLPLLDAVTPLAGVLGVVNTVTFAVAPGADPEWSDPRGRTRLGDNTDVHGIVTALAQVAGEGLAATGPLLVLGAGATAASALAAGQLRGHTEAVVLARSPQRAEHLVGLGERLGLRVRTGPLEQVEARTREAAAVVSTLPPAAADALVVRPRPGAVLLDVVYDPWPTALAAAWEAGGGLVADGALMLLHQAVRQVELMTGRVPDPAAMASALPRPVVRGR